MRILLLKKFVIVISQIQMVENEKNIKEKIQGYFSKIKVVTYQIPIKMLTWQR